jgi:hypothetical protein
MRSRATGARNPESSPTATDSSAVSTTLNVYSHLFEQPGQEVARRIQARIEKVMAGDPKPQKRMSANRSDAPD